MSNNNDQRILELKKQIQEKKEKLGKTLRFVPVTNCSIELDGERFNIQVLQRDQLIPLMVKLNAYFMSAKALGYSEEYVISGFSPLDWIEDIDVRLRILSRKDEEKQLKVMEDKLTKMLSERKKVELELDEITSMLNK